jgi:hypothetical protein
LARLQSTKFFWFFFSKKNRRKHFFLKKEAKTFVHWLSARAAGSHVYLSKGSRMEFFALFFAGAFGCNAIPHLCAGLRGEPFPTPFATPHGVGNSSPLLNFLWGSGNAGACVALMSACPVVFGINLKCFMFVAGAMTLGIYLSRHFGKVRNAATK